MALIEIELRQNVCAKLAHFILQKSPIPAPWLSLFGPSRLLSGPFDWQLPIIGESIPGFPTPPGTIPIRASVTITHISLDELKANANATHTRTDCIAWLLMVMEMDRLQLNLLRLESVGHQPQTFSIPLFIGEQILPLEGVDDLQDSAVVFQEEILTIRFAVGGNDNLLVPSINLLSQFPGDNWLIRVSGAVFVDQVLQKLNEAVNKAVSPPSSGIKKHSGPAALWSPNPNLTAGDIQLPGFPADDWGVLGSMQLKKEDACGDVDLIITISVALAISPDTTTNRVNLALRLSSDVSDDDVARCWLITGGVGSILIGLYTNFVVGIIVALQSLIAIAEFIRLESGSELKGTSAGGDFTEAGSDDNSVWYTGHKGLPVFPTGTNISATTGPHGLVVRGNVSIEPLPHTITFEPDGGLLETHWSGHYSCREHVWKTTCEVQSVVVRDLIFLLDPSQPSGRRLISGNGVTVFPTTKFLTPGPDWLGPVNVAPGIWEYDAPSWAQGSPVITPRCTAPPPGEEVLFILHTSAGIKRFDIGPIPAIPERAESPTSSILAIHKVNCKTLTRQWTNIQELQWLIDPPPYDYGTPPLRQWRLTFQRLRPGASITIIAKGAQEERIVRHEFNESETAFIEVVTAADSELSVQHNLNDVDAEVRVSQRWLLPTLSLSLPGEAKSLLPARTRNGSVMPILLIEGIWYMLGADSLVKVERAPVADSWKQHILSLSLPGGPVTVIWNNMIMTAVPYGSHERIILHERPADELGA